jgi:hypothetical protein
MAGGEGGSVDMSVLAFFTAALGLGVAAYLHKAGCLEPEYLYSQVPNGEISRCQLQQPVTGNK